MNTETDRPRGDSLRERAEQVLARREPAAGQSEADARRLLHELQVHQIELELQNEALRQAQAETEAARSQLAVSNTRLEAAVQASAAAQQRSEVRALQILQASADGLYGIDARGRITFINPAACRLLGVREEQALGQSSHELFHARRPDGSPYPEAECPAHTVMRLGATFRCDKEVFWHADGRAIPVMYAVHPLLVDGRSEGAVISFVDISAQQATAAAREQALAAAERLAQLRSQFLANMSHEIRTPLNGVLGFAEIGARSLHDPEKVRRAFEQIKASGQRLLGVINDILDFSKIEAGRLSVEAVEVDLAAVLRQSVDLVDGLVKSKHLDLVVQVSERMPRAFVGDPLRIGQVLLNLLGNAAKFTASGGITLSAGREGDRLVFSVADTGIGIDEASIGRLFQPFEQADGSMTRRFGGSGLGLAISRRLVELMGGSMQVKSQVGVGSTFSFRLPYVALAGPATAPPRADAVRSRPLAGLSVLVAEDEPVSQWLLQDMLADFGARVVVVGNGKAAVERVASAGAEAFDVVLMDVQMPELDGYAATRLLAALAPGLPVIGQTAHATPEERARCFAVGMVDHIAKPLQPEELVRLILRHRAVRGPSTPSSSAASDSATSMPSTPADMMPPA